MSNRIKKVKHKKAVQNIYANIFDTLNEKGLTITSKNFGNGYFIFKHGANMVCHFKIKEMPDWKFGIWLAEGLKSYEIFGEHIDLIDKFKPSRCPICDQSAETFTATIKPLLGNPALAYYQSLFDDPAEDAVMQAEYDKHLKEKELENCMEEALEEKAFRFFKNDLFKQFPALLNIGVTDGNLSGWICNPRYEIYGVVDFDKYSDEELDELLKQMIDFVWDENRRFYCFSNHHEFTLRDICDPEDIHDLQFNWMFSRKTN